MHETHEFLKTLALVLCVAAVTTVVFQRLRQPVVLGYLLAGMVIGPHVPVPLVADSRIVLSLAELGVILLMFSLGIEFSLQKLTRVGATAGFVAVVECSLMVWLGYLLGQSFGWSRLASLYTGAVIAISSTTIIAKTYEEKQAEGEFTQIVFGVLIVEDLIAIVLITILTGLSAGDQISLGTVAQTAGRLGLFLLVLLVVGLLTVPRLMRAIVQLGRNETTVVANVGLAFGLAYLASSFGYSVALGAFIAGSLVAESGAEKQIEELIIPVRDIFAALFFVSVGMLIDPQAIVQNWLFVLIFLAVLVAGKVGAISLATFLTGRSVVTSIQTGMSLAQIGEFSFIIAGVGLMNNADDQPTYQLLYSIAIAVSGVTTLLTPWLIRAAEPVAMFVDRKLPRPLQTFAALYGSWLQQSRSASPRGETGRVRHFMRWLAVDAVVLAVVVIGAAVEVEPLADWITARAAVTRQAAYWMIVALAALVSAPFWIGIIGVARVLGFELACRAFPQVGEKRIDMAAAPRRLLVVTLQMAIVLLVGTPLLAVTQPFLPIQGGLVLLALLGLLAVAFWRGATNFQGHARATAQLIAESLALQMRAKQGERRPSAPADMARLLIGMGTPVPVQLPAHSLAVGKTLAELNLRGQTGATVLTIRRGSDDVVIPAGDEHLLAGDILALAGTKEAIAAASEQLLGS